MAASEAGVEAARRAILPEAEALGLVRRVAGVRGLPWPAQAGAVTGVGGMAADVAGNPGSERVAWATLNGRDGVIGLFSGDRLLDSANRSLGQVQRVQLVTLPGLPYRALMVDDLVDQRTGAHLIEEHRRLYVWDGHRMRQVYLGVLRREQLTHAQWDNPRGPAVWRRLREEGEITLRGLILTERSQTRRAEAVGSSRAPVPPDSQFRLRCETESLRRFRWDPRLRRFDPA